MKKLRKTEEIHYLFDLAGNVIEEKNITKDETESSVYLKNRLLARVKDDETLIYGTDYLGTAILVTDENVSMVWNAESTPFGDHVMVGEVLREDIRLKYTGKGLMKM